MSPQTRVIGGRTFSAIGYGGMGLSISYGTAGTDEERFKVLYPPLLGRCRGCPTLIELQVLDAVYESGSTFWDTADVYGDNEDLIGEW